MNIRSALLGAMVLLLVAAAYLMNSGSISIPEFQIPLVSGPRSVRVSFVAENVTGEGMSKGWAEFEFPDRAAIGRNLVVSGNVSLLLDTKTLLPGTFEGRVLHIRSGVEFPLSENVNFTANGTFPFTGDISVNGTFVITANNMTYRAQHAEIRSFNGTVATGRDGISVSGMANSVRIIGDTEITIRSR